jgi:hypothetical protein
VVDAPARLEVGAATGMPGAVVVPTIRQRQRKPALVR